ncbi:MAG: hypothetical protein R3B70_03400 [Polyangiaceae bacterium]
MSIQAPYRAHVAPPPVAASAAICRSCGIVAPEQAGTCAECGRPIAEVRVQVPPQGADTYWVAVKCGFTCNQCKFLAPLDGLDVDGAVDCAHCGLRQRFDVSAWRGALAFAHAVGDLAGPDPEGRAPHPAIWIGDINPHAKVGVELAYADGAQKVETIDIQASPGHPVCKRCRVPLTVSLGGHGRVNTRCMTCGDEASFTLSDAGRAGYPALVAAVADEHRTDRPRAQPMPTQAGVIAIRCPGCGAPLSVQGSEKLQTCGFCKAACFVAGRNLAKFLQKTPEPEVWWLLFRGPSEERGSLTSAEAETAADGKQVMSFLNPKPQTDTIKDQPGVYEAPEEGGTHWPQVVLTVLLGLIAAAVGYLIAGK